MPRGMTRMPHASSPIIHAFSPDCNPYQKCRFLKKIRHAAATSTLSAMTAG